MCEVEMKPTAYLHKCILPQTAECKDSCVWCRRCRSSADADCHSGKARNLAIACDQVHQQTTDDAADRAAGVQRPIAKGQKQERNQEETQQVDTSRQCNQVWISKVARLSAVSHL